MDEKYVNSLTIRMLESEWVDAHWRWTDKPETSGLSKGDLKEYFKRFPTQIHRVWQNPFMVDLGVFFKLCNQISFNDYLVKEMKEHLVFDYDRVKWVLNWFDSSSSGSEV